MNKYRCQSAWKLVELDDRFHLFTRSHCRTVVDLAAAPGGFAQVALERMAAVDDKVKHISPCRTLSAPIAPLVVAVDQRPIEPLSGLITLQENILNHGKVLAQLDDVLRQIPPTSTPSQSAHRSVEVVLHDGVSVVAGQRAFSVTYAQSQMALSCLQLACRIFATYVPTPTGAPPSTSDSSPGRRKPVPVFFVSKVMNCAHLSSVTAACRAFFSHVQLHKPIASKEESRERYLIAYGFKDGLWDSFQKRPAPGGDRQRNALAANVFSLCPAPGDAGSSADIIWHCLGCGQMRMGMTPCSQCVPRRPRRRH